MTVTKDYKRGYAAGVRNASKNKEDAFWRECYMIALNQTMSAGSWQTGGKRWTSGKEYADGCKNLANDFFNEARKAGRI